MTGNMIDFFTAQKNERSGYLKSWILPRKHKDSKKIKVEKQNFVTSCLCGKLLNNPFETASLLFLLYTKDQLADRFSGLTYNNSIIIYFQCIKSLSDSFWLY